jgi:transcriptional regulator GlxA family with amidase domain
MDLTRSDMTPPPSDQTTRVGVLLIPGFALLPYACTIDPLRAANTLSGRPLYEWTNLSPDGAPATASSGLAVPAACRLADAPPLDIVLVVAGGNPATFRDTATFDWLRRVARGGARMGGVSGGPWLLARAGLLHGHRLTLHWEHAEAFAEEFPDLDLRRSLFEIDRLRLTCSGGTSPLDMMHAVIAGRHGAGLAIAVSDWFMQSEIREGANPQRMALRHRTGTSNRALLRVLEAMERAVETPLPRATLADMAGVSLRQLERLFHTHLGRTPGEHYALVRLDRSRLLLRQSGLSILEVAVACGFGSASHFSRAYRRAFGHTPSAERLGR